MHHEIFFVVYYFYLIKLHIVLLTDGLTRRKLEWFFARVYMMGLNCTFYLINFLIAREGRSGSGSQIQRLRRREPQNISSAVDLRLCSMCSRLHVVTGSGTVMTRGTPRRPTCLQRFFSPLQMICAVSRQ